MSKKSGKLSLLVGLGIGTVAAVLFAPTRGKELRAMITKEIHKGGSGLEAVKKSLATMMTGLVDVVEDTANKNEQVIKAKRKIKKGVVKARATIQRVRAKAVTVAKKVNSESKKAVNTIKSEGKSQMKNLKSKPAVKKATQVIKKQMKTASKQVKAVKKPAVAKKVTKAKKKN